MAWLMAPGQGEPLTFLEDLVHRPAWQRYGACHGEYVETFIPGLGGNFTKAREVCRECAVRPECLAFAMADEEIVGMRRDDRPRATGDEGCADRGVTQT
jgi:hypothetical protein